MRWTYSKKAGLHMVVVCCSGPGGPMPAGGGVEPKGTRHGARQLTSAETEHENPQWSQPLPLPISSSKKWLM